MEKMYKKQKKNNQRFEYFIISSPKGQMSMVLVL